MPTSSKPASYYDADYFLRGPKSGKSLYEDYRWMPDLTVPFARRIVEHFKLQPGTRILDFGCARGYLVHALRLIGMESFGVDISKWAIACCHPKVQQYVWCNGLKGVYDLIIAKDVLEHLDRLQCHNVLLQMRYVSINLFVIVPLGDGSNYVIPEMKLDKSHVLALNREQWTALFLEAGWHVNDFSYHCLGIKDKWAVKHPYGHGLFTCNTSTGVSLWTRWTGLLLRSGLWCCCQCCALSSSG